MVPSSSASSPLTGLFLPAAVALLAILVASPAVVNVVRSFPISNVPRHHHPSLSFGSSSSSPLLLALQSSTPTRIIQQQTLLRQDRTFFQKRHWIGSSSSSSSSSTTGLALSENDNTNEETESPSTSTDADSGTSTVTTPAATTTTTPLSTTIRQFLQRLWLQLNLLGSSFKDRAQRSTAKCYEATTKSSQFLYSVQACVYYSLFIVYRAYRGFFVLLPAVFKQVYTRMAEAMESSDMALIETEEQEEEAEGGEGDVYKPTQQRWRTRLTVSVLASVVTVSYMIGGTVQMATKFFKTLTKSSNVPKSFEAAADGMVSYETKIEKLSGSSSKSSTDDLSSSTMTINGASPATDDTDDDDDKLTP